MFLTYDTVEAFALKRNPSVSFPFLKENGELISICVNSGVLIEPRALPLYKDFYDNAYKLTQSYPQYYRFTLAMAIDLELGGIQGRESQKLAQYVDEDNFVMFDTSDVRRLETLSMLLQIGGLSKANKQLLDDIIERVEIFIQNPAWYTKFNKPLFYDLTHIVFFLTDYGKKPTSLKTELFSCLMHIGTLALLDDDADLLSETCICLMYIGQAVPQYWDEYLTRYRDEIRITFDGTIASALNPTVDEYHIYLVLNAYHAARGRPVFQDKFKSRTPSFSLPERKATVLEKLSNFSHETYFTSRRRSASLDGFVSSLGEAEYLHWQSSLNSAPNGQDLVSAFSGLS